MSNQAISLYRDLLRQGLKLASYNFRQYAVRRTRDAFLAHRSETDPQVIRKYLTDATEQLEVLRRQALISQMFKGDRLVVESMSKKL